MRRGELKVIRYKFSDTSPWMISGYSEDGMRKRLFFKTEKAAKEELKKIKIKLRREGEAGLAIADWLRVSALQCQKDIEELDPKKTIRDATDHYLKYLRDSAKKNITVSALITQFIVRQKTLERSHVNVRDVTQRLGLES